MIHRADKYLAQRHGKEPEWIPGTVPILPTFSDQAATPDDYHSAREPSESEYDTEETDPEEDRDDVEGDDDDVSVGSDTTFKSSGHDTDRTNRMTTANQTQRHNQRKRKESWGWHPTNARKEDERRKGKVVLSLFRDSPKEGALMYTDWCTVKLKSISGRDTMIIESRMPCCLPARDRLTLTFVPATKEGIALRRRS